MYPGLADQRRKRTTLATRAATRKFPRRTRRNEIFATRLTLRTYLERETGFEPATLSLGS